MASNVQRIFELSQSVSKELSDYEKNPCTFHYISEPVISQLVINAMKRILRRIIQDEKGFCEELKQKWSEQNNNRPQQ